MRTAVFYAETISGTTEMQHPFEGCGKRLSARSSADDGWGQEENAPPGKQRKKLRKVERNDLNSFILTAVKNMLWSIPATKKV